MPGMCFLSLQLATYLILGKPLLLVCLSVIWELITTLKVCNMFSYNWKLGAHTAPRKDQISAGRNEFTLALSSVQVCHTLQPFGGCCMLLFLLQVPSLLHWLVICIGGQEPLLVSLPPPDSTFKIREDTY